MTPGTQVAAADFAVNAAWSFVLLILALKTIVLTHLLSCSGTWREKKKRINIIRIDLVTSLPKPPIWRKSPSRPPRCSASLALCARRRFLWQPRTLLWFANVDFYQTSISSLTHIQGGHFITLRVKKKKKSSTRLNFVSWLCCEFRWRNLFSLSWQDFWFRHWFLVLEMGEFSYLISIDYLLLTRARRHEDNSLGLVLLQKTNPKT